MGPVDDEVTRGRKWWQRLPVLVLVGVLPVPFGLFFLAFIAIALLLTDATRESETRAGGGVLLFWWAYNFREGDTAPYFAAFLLVAGAVLLVRGALRRRRDGGQVAWMSYAGAAVAVVLAVAAYVPYGYRPPELTREAAVRRTVEERTAHPWRGIKADEYLVDRGRERFLHTPLWYVVLYERNPTVPRTLDGEGCFSRREVWRVDALDGQVSRVTYDEASFGGDPCLPVRLGTREDLKPVP
jgi:hypothetical protein